MAYKTLVSAAVVAEHLQDNNWLIMDCRFDLSRPEAGLQSWQKSHIPGAVYVNLNEDMAGPHTTDSGRHPLPDPSVLANKLRGWGLNHDSQAVVYDDAHGAIAARMWWLLRWLGHDRTALLDGGFDHWLQSGYPGNQETGEARIGHFQERPDDTMWVDTSYIESMLENDNFALIDARHPDRYSGAKETIDPEGGHIPTAVNHFFMNNIDPDTACFLSAEKLRERHTALLRKTTVHSCGSGVTACHNLLAMEIAGLPMSPLYVGSWSEWIRDPKRRRARSNQP